MSLAIVRASEPIPVSNVIITVFGQPGAWKTSFACTARAPLLLDFDLGAHRTKFRPDTVRITDWEQIAKITDEDLAEYETIVIDTAGRAIDRLATYLMRSNPKLQKRSGALTLEGYGEVKVTFAQWLSARRAHGRDLIVVCHDKEDKRGTQQIVRPDVAGASYDEIFKVSDAVGYIHMVENKHVIEFAPADEWVAKDPASLGSVEIPNLETHRDFARAILTRIKAALGEISAEGARIAGLVEQLREEIAGFTTAAHLQASLEALKAMERPVYVQGRAILSARMRELGLAFDKDTGKFVAAKKNGGAPETAAEAELADAKKNVKALQEEVDSERAAKDFPEREPGSDDDEGPAPADAPLANPDLLAGAEPQQTKKGGRAKA